MAEQPDQDARELDRSLRLAESALQAALRGQQRDQEVIDRQYAHLEALRRRFGQWESRIVTMRADVARLRLEVASRRRPVQPLGLLERSRPPASELAP